MLYREENINLFSLDKDYYLCHCISADVYRDKRSMNMGIAVDFNNRFNMKEKIKKFCREKNLVLRRGTCLLIENTFNLISKDVYYGKPRYSDIKSCLLNMKKIIQKKNIKKVGFCQIGTRLDMLEFEKVKKIIKEVFQDVDVEILICLYDDKMKIG